MRVEVYRNLQRGKLSVRGVRARVLSYEDLVFLRDVQLVVGQKGRERVLREKQKNVHAFARGDWCDLDDPTFERWAEWMPVTYDPYVAGHFYPKDLGPKSEVRSVWRAAVTIEGLFVKLL